MTKLLLFGRKCTDHSSAPFLGLQMYEVIWNFHRLNQELFVKEKDEMYLDIVVFYQCQGHLLASEYFTRASHFLHFELFDEGRKKTKVN